MKSRNYATDSTKASLLHNTAANGFERGTKDELYHSQNPALNGLAVWTKLILDIKLETPQV